MAQNKDVESAPNASARASEADDSVILGFVAVCAMTDHDLMGKLEEAAPANA